MTDYDQARSSEGKGKSATTETAWASLWWPMETNSHGEALISPKFQTQGECVSWVRGHKIRNGLEAQVGMFKRVSRAGGDYEDIPLSTMDAPLPSPEKVHDLVAGLKDMIAAKKRELDKGPVKGVPAKRPARSMDPLEVPALTYDEVYDENGNQRFPVDANGWPILPEHN